MVFHILRPKIDSVKKLPYYLSFVRAGFPSPADDYIEKLLDLNEHLIKHPASTFFVKVKGLSMVNAGILDGDILIVDRSIRASNGKIIVAVVNGEFTVKRFKKYKDKTYLVAENPDHPQMEINENIDFEIWGVVVHAIHNV